MRLSTYKNLDKMNQIDAMGMACVYAVHLLLMIVYVILTLSADYSLDGSMIFYLFYSTTAGAAAVLDIFLLRGALKLYGMGKTRTLLALSIGNQLLNMAADITFAFKYGGFWLDGYVWLAAELLVIFTYARRLVVLRRLEKLITDDVDYYESMKNRPDTFDRRDTDGYKHL